MDLRETACGGPDDAPKRRPPVGAAVKQFLLLALGSMLAPKMSRLCDLDYAEYMVGRVEDIATFNCSGFVARNLNLGDIHFLMIHLLDFLNMRGFATKTIPTCSYWFDPRVDKNVSRGIGNQGRAARLLLLIGGRMLTLETLEDDELKSLESLTEKVMDVWETRRDSIWRVVIMRHQGNN
ncbi:unnamed protein product [Linum trigynum]|uniref:Uncharacterized protein n=1 Tax=Linum trigynum TaxID=586398 RepID=A0AAV2DF36_9ROSI